MTNEFRAMCAELLAWAEHTSSHYYKQPDVLDRARDLLAQPEPEVPTDEELISSIMWMLDDCVYDNDSGEIAQSLRRLIARWGRPTPQPVPVSERLPGPEDCDGEGRCWLGGRQMGRGTPTWLLGYPAWAKLFPDVHRLWLPANALPTPEATND